MIEVNGLAKRFGGRAALDGVTLAVPEGEALALVGPNGSGKTVLLRILATLVPADSGDAVIGGRSVADDPVAVRSLIGYMPEVSGIHPGVTTREDIEFHAGVHGFNRERRAVVASELLDVVGLADRAGDDVGQLSRGQRQRLGLARALVHDPEVLLLDDPLGLDPHAQVDLRDLVKSLRGMGKTLVISGHHLPELEDMCTWVGVLDRATLVASGPMDEVRGADPSLTDAVLRLTGRGAP